MTDDPTRALDASFLKRELLGLFEYVQRVRQEIAAISRPAEDAHRFESMGDQLDLIVQATEDATNTIMEAVETNIELLASLRTGVRDGRHQAVLDRMAANQNRIIEACSFQDITGQRVSKVVKSLAYVEERVNNLIHIWGKDALDRETIAAECAKSGEDALLNGPQDPETALAQAEIDALFG